MNILFVNDCGIKGAGTEKRLELLIHSLLKQGYFNQIHLLEYEHSNSHHIAGIHIHKCTTKNSGEIILNIINKHAIDIIQIHNLALISVRVIKVVKKLKKPIIFSAHDYWPFCGRRDLLFKGKQQCSGSNLVRCSSCIGLKSYFTTLKNRYWLNKCDVGIAPTDYVIRIYENQDILKHKWNKVLPWVTTEEFYPINLEKDKLTILFVGSLSYYKGIDFVIAALYEIKKEFPNIVLRIAGTDQELTNLNRLRIDSLIRRYCLNDNVVYLGHRIYKELIQEYKKALIFVASPMWPEPSALSVQEALCSGCFVLVNDKGGISEFVNPDQVFTTKEQFVKKIITFIKCHKNPAINVIEDYVKLFRPERAVKDLISIYEKWRR